MLSFGRLRQRIVLKCVPQVQHYLLFTCLNSLLRDPWQLKSILNYTISFSFHYCYKGMRFDT